MIVLSIFATTSCQLPPDLAASLLLLLPPSFVNSSSLASPLLLRTAQCMRLLNNSLTLNEHCHAVRHSFSFHRHSSSLPGSFHPNSGSLQTLICHDYPKNFTTTTATIARDHSTFCEAVRRSVSQSWESLHRLRSAHRESSVVQSRSRGSSTHSLHERRDH